MWLHIKAKFHHSLQNFRDSERICSSYPFALNPGSFGRGEPGTHCACRNSQVSGLGCFFVPGPVTTTSLLGVFLLAAM